MNPSTAPSCCTNKPLAKPEQVSQKDTVLNVRRDKKKNVVVRKSFRLFDFHVYDDMTNKDDSDSSSTEGGGGGGGAAATAFIIQMFGVNEFGETCCIFVEDYQPFFFIKVGKSWNEIDAYNLLLEIRKKVGKLLAPCVLSAELVEYKKLYGFTGGKKDNFVKIVFQNSVTMNRVKNLWYEYKERGSSGGGGEPGEGNDRVRKPFYFKSMSLELYESSIPPLLRYFHIHNISPSGWVSFRLNHSFKVEPRTTTCTYEYKCSLEELTPMPEKETAVPYKICSFDIEASSSHGDFPIPVKTYKRFAMNLVDVFLKQAPVIMTDKTKGAAVLKKVVLAAFGYGSFENVDLVYPKVAPPNKSAILELVAEILDKPMEDIKSTVGGGVADRILRIDSMFDQLKEFSSGCVGGDDGGEGGGGGGGDDEGGEGVVGGGGSGDNEERHGWSSHAYSLSKKKPKIQKKYTLLDVLLASSTQYERDEKITLANDLLTRTFPPLEGDKVTFIGSTFMKYGEREPYMNHCLVLGSCDPVEGAIIESVDTEKELLVKWSQLIQSENPDIIIGYNIFGFDTEFMFRRAQETECIEEFLLLSRRKDEMCAKRTRDGDMAIENVKMKIASGEYDLRFFKMTGRLQIDMYAYFRRDFNLSSYKLDDVACQFISDDIKKIVCTQHATHGQVTELYSQNLMGLNIHDYIHIEITGFTSDYYRNGHKFVVLDILRGVVDEVGKTWNVIVIAGHETELVGCSASKSLKWGTAKDDVSPQDIFRLANGSAADRAVVAKYCIQDCNLVHHLMNKIDVMTGYVEMSRICSVPISFLVFRGQGIKLTSFVAKKCREKNTLMPDLEKPKEAEGYEGAIVLPPKCSMYMDNPVACVDYSSLYPSSMISQNFSHDSKVWTREYNLEGQLVYEWGEKDNSGEFIYDNLPGYQYIDMEFDTYKYLRKTKTSREEKTKVGRIICRWAQLPDNQKSIMPSILEELLKARSDTRKMIKTEKDPFMQNILDKRQLGYKVTANSLYGQCGSRTSTFYEKDVAAATTATGRMMITYAKRIIEEVYGNLEYDTEKYGTVLTKAEYVYGDSVASYTPIYILPPPGVDVQQSILCIAIDELADKYGNGLWVRCLDKGRETKEICVLKPGVKTWTEKGWTPLKCVIRHDLAAHKKMIRVMTPMGLVDVTDDHSLLLAEGAREISPKEVRIGTELLHHDLPMVRGGAASSYFPSRSFRYQKDAAEYYLYASQKSHCRIDWDEGMDGSYQVIVDDDDYSVENVKGTMIAVKRMKEITDYSGYVYDLTTENHHFAAGIGNMIVHNTDSVFFTFNLEDPKTGEKIRGKEALEITIEIAQDAAHLCTKWLKPPMELSYEKTLMPFILLSKKRYVGMLYETDPNKGKMKFMGLSIKRRDSCDYLKDVYGAILNILMKEQNVQSAVEFLNTSLTQLVAGKVPIEKLMITKALRGYYKNPQQIGHRVLADRIGKRDPGNMPKPGDRMKFVFVRTANPKALMGDKIETPEFIQENGLTVDYTHYVTNQLMKPLQQLFGLALEQIWEKMSKRGELKKYRTELAKLEKECGEDLEVFMKKKEKICSARIKDLLFTKILNQISNQENRMNELTSYFKKV
jgi:DNA polymerase elongation subunit (family B)